MRVLRGVHPQYKTAGETHHSHYNPLRDIVYPPPACYATALCGILRASTGQEDIQERHRFHILCPQNIESHILRTQLTSCTLITSVPA